MKIGAQAHHTTSISTSNESVIVVRGRNLTDELIGRITDKSPTAIRRGKYAMRAIASMSFDEAIAYTETQIALLAMTEDAKEGRKAFAEKRKPVWPGK